MELLAGLMRGDEVAWQRFLAVFYPQVVATIKRSVQDTDKAEDLASEIVVLLVNVLRSFTDPAGPASPDKS